MDFDSLPWIAFYDQFAREHHKLWYFTWNDFSFLFRTTSIAFVRKWKNYGICSRWKKSNDYFKGSLKLGGAFYSLLNCLNLWFIFTQRSTGINWSWELFFSLLYSQFAFFGCFRSRWWSNGRTLIFLYLCTIMGKATTANIVGSMVSGSSFTNSSQSSASTYRPASTTQMIYQRFAIQPQDQTAVIGSRVTLPCRVLDQKGPIQWTKDDFGLGAVRNLTGFERYAMIGSDEEGKWFDATEISNTWLLILFPSFHSSYASIFLPTFFLPPIFIFRAILFSPRLNYAWHTFFSRRLHFYSFEN